MKQTITQSMFIDDMRAIRPDNFSYEGLEFLFDYLDQFDTELEFDPIGICCDFSQCSLREFIDSYGVELEEGQSQYEAVNSFMQKNGFWFAFVEGDQEVIFENL